MPIPNHADPKPHAHEPHQVCIEHSPIETLLLARLGLVLRPTALGIEMEVSNMPDGSALAQVKWVDRASSKHRSESYPGPTRAQAILVAIELLEREGRQRPGAYTA